MRQLDMNTAAAATATSGKAPTYGIVTVQVGEAQLEGYILLSPKNLQRLGLTQEQALGAAGKTARLDGTLKIRFGQAEERQGDGSGFEALRFD